MQYQEAVQEARQLVKRSEADQWRLAQLTYEQVKAGKSRRQWAQDIGVSADHAERLYAVWAHWGMPPRGGTRPKFSEAYAMAREGAESPEEGRRLTDERQAISAIRQMTPERKAQVAREVLNDPDVAVRTLRDPHTRRQITDAREQVAQEIEQTAELRHQASPVQHETGQSALFFQIGHLLRDGRFKLAEATRLLQDLEERDETTFEDDAEDVQDALDWFNAVRRGGKVDDAALAKLLEGGAS
jgi:Family of unknown function (DUF6192)